MEKSFLKQPNLSDNISSINKLSPSIVLKKVIQITGNPKEFLKKKNSERQLIQRKIDIFLGVDRNFTYINNLNPNRASKSKDLCNEYDHEMVLFKKYFFSRRHSKALTSCIAICEEVELVANKLLLTLGFSKKKTKVNESIFCEIIFSEMIAVCLEISQNSIIEKSSFYIYNSALLSRLTNWVAQNILYTVLGNPSSKTVVNIIRLISKPPVDAGETANLVYAFNKASGKLADMAISCGFLSGLLGQSSTSFSVEELKSEKSYSLTPMKANMGLFSSFFPRFIRPAVVTKKNKKEELYYAQKPVFAGNGSIQWSAQMLKFLNLANGKPFRINEVVLESLNALIAEVNNPTGDCDAETMKVCVNQLHFYPNKLLGKKLFEVKVAQKVLNKQKFNVFAYNQFKTNLKKVTKSFTSGLGSNSATKVLGINREFIKIYHTCVSLKKEYDNMVKKNSVFFLKIEGAQILKGFPLFYTNTFDYRGRFYTQEWLFGKTNG